MRRESTHFFAVRCLHATMCLNAEVWLTFFKILTKCSGYYENMSIVEGSDGSISVKGLSLHTGTGFTGVSEKQNFSGY